MSLRAASLLSLSALVVVTGCSTLRVSNGTAGSETKVAGVPFYVKKERVLQVTRYQYVTYLVAVSIRPPGADAANAVQIGTVEVREQAYRGDSMRTFREAVDRAAGSGNTFDEASKTLRDALRALAASGSPGRTDWLEEEHIALIGNGIERELYVDRSTPYYWNSRAPLFGSAKSEVTLAPDGTLTTGKAESDDKTLEQVLAVVPAKEYLSKVLSLTPAEAEKAAGQVTFMSKQAQDWT